MKGRWGLVLLALVACSGEDGAAGAPGAKGEKGDPGATGATGAAGTNGDAGTPGAPGDAGPSGIVTVLGFDAEDILPSLPGNTATVPAKCRTASYTAGPGETAIVAMDGTLYPQSAPLAVVSFKAAVATNGAATFTPVSTESLASLQSAVASASVDDVVPLEAGTTYVFGESLYCVTASGPLTKSSCHATVTIVRP